MNEWTRKLPPVIPVSLLVSSARLLIERQLGLSWVSGEVSNHSQAASGHTYFVLKDDDAQVRCVLYRSKAQFLDFILRNGQRVEVRAVPTIYEPRGEFQLSVESVRLSGSGALYEQFARRKARLEAAGWFAPARKRSLPSFPGAIGIVTSVRAAALSDVLATLRHRMPAVPVVIYPASVQGSGAAAEIATAIATANAHGRVDVLILCRGGGSIEDLWAFNEEVVAKAVFESRIPIVSGVGHETDFTICDFVADVRAPTPTAAAAVATPDGAALSSAVRRLAARWQHAAHRQLERDMQRLDVAARHLVHPATWVAGQLDRLESLRRRLAGVERAALALRGRDVATLGRRLVQVLRRPPGQRTVLDRVHARWQRGAERRVADTAHRVAKLSLALKHLDPQAVLDRGYSIVSLGTGAVVQSASELAAGDTVALRFARGSADATVTRTRTDSSTT